MKEYSNENNINIVTLDASDSFEFIINENDTVFVLMYNEGISNIVSKIATIRESKSVNLKELSQMLGIMKIGKLNIFSIDKNSKSDTVTFITANKGSVVNYVDIKPEYFINNINVDNNRFYHYNKNSVYILRRGNFLDIKNLFAIVKSYQVNVGRWKDPKKSCIKSFGY